MNEAEMDRSMLFGVLALQAGFLDAGQFATAYAHWIAQGDKPLADVLVQYGFLTREDRAAIDELVRRKLAKDAAAVNPSGEDRAAPEGPEPIPGTPALLRPSQDGEVNARPTGPSTVASPPEQRDRFMLVRLHAQGGIGRIWIARDNDLGREVALKELLPEYSAKPTVCKRFLDEACITGQLEHPGIVPVYALARPGRFTSPYYTMRLIKGRTLADAIQDYHQRRRAAKATRLDLRELLTSFLAVCNAVAYAHSRGVIHRDLKPQNIIVGEFGEAIVLDWGVAKVIGKHELAAALTALPEESDRSSAGTVEGQVLGTPAYMPPEQAEGRLDQVDERSDVYGLGAALYEILTGRPPFVGENTRDILRRVVHDLPQPPGELVPLTAPALEAICLKALAKDPPHRYSSVRELALELQRWLAREPVQAYREPWVHVLARWFRRHTLLVLAGYALLLIGFGTSATWLAQREHYQDQLRLGKAERRAGRAELGSNSHEMQYADTLCQLARLYRNAHQPSHSREALTKAQAIYQRLARTQPIYFVTTALLTALDGDYQQAVPQAEAALLAETEVGVTHYEAACVYALSAGDVLKDALLPKIKQQRLAEDYATKAVELLGRALSAGVIELHEVERNKDLDPIRTRDDFRKVMERARAAPQRVE